MAIARVLITVKTYPTLSTKYDELVCTAGFLENGTWIRIYPIPFRKKSYHEQYKKYDWIEVDLVKNTEDFRPESYRPYSHETPIKIVGHIDTKSNWALRKEIVLKNIHTSLANLIKQAHNKETCTSLAVYKPKRIIDFIYEEVAREWDKDKKMHLQQLKLFEEKDGIFEVVKKLPYKFSFVFEDETGKKRRLMIEDWETGQLYWNCLEQHEGNEHKACEAVKFKYLNDFTKTKDLYFFLGTTKSNHYVSLNPYIIIGTFHPKKEEQMKLF